MMLKMQTRYVHTLKSTALIDNEINQRPEIDDNYQFGFKLKS